jgi:hypothetical protein
VLLWTRVVLMGLCDVGLRHARFVLSALIPSACLRLPVYARGRFFVPRKDVIGHFHGEDLLYGREDHDPSLLCSMHKTVVLESSS